MWILVATALAGWTIEGPAFLTEAAASAWCARAGPSCEHVPGRDGHYGRLGLFATEAEARASAAHALQATAYPVRILEASRLVATLGRARVSSPGDLESTVLNAWWRGANRGLAGDALYARVESPGQTVEWVRHGSRVGMRADGVEAVVHADTEKGEIRGPDGVREAYDEALRVMRGYATLDVFRPHTRDHVGNVVWAALPVVLVETHRDGDEVRFDYPSEGGQGAPGSLVLVFRGGELAEIRRGDAITRFSEPTSFEGRTVYRRVETAAGTYLRLSNAFRPETPDSLAARGVRTSRWPDA